jgi:hypothetical protein
MQALTHFLNGGIFLRMNLAMHFILPLVVTTVWPKAIPTTTEESCTGEAYATIAGRAVLA